MSSDVESTKSASGVEGPGQLNEMGYWNRPLMDQMRTGNYRSATTQVIPAGQVICSEYGSADA